MGAQSFDLGGRVETVEEALEHRQFRNGIDRPFGGAAIGVATSQPEQKRRARDHHHPAKIFGNDSFHGYPSLPKPLSQPLCQGLAITPRVGFLIFPWDGLEEISDKGDLRAGVISPRPLESRLRSHSGQYRMRVRCTQRTSNQECCLLV